MGFLSSFSDGLARVFVEQATPLEMIIFVFVVVAACMALAALIYVVVMSAIWAIALRSRNVGLRRVFLPSAEQFHESAAEYLIAIFTSLILAVTTIAKHGLVEQIRNWPAEALPGLANLFPLQTVPDAVHNVIGEMTVESVLKPALDAGETGRVRVALEGLINQGIPLPSTRGILIACGLMIIIHLLWLASQRYELLSKSPETDGRLGYDKTARSLLVLSVCVALLLAAPAMVGDPEHLARSSIASLEHVEASTVPYYDVVLAAIDQQRRDLSILEDASGQVFDPDAGVQESVWSAIANRLDAHDVAVSDLTTRLDVSDESVDALGARVGATATDLSGAESALGDIDRRLAGLLDRLEGIAGTVDGLQARVTTLEATSAEMAARADRFDIRVAGLAARVTVNEEQVTALRDSVTETRSQLGDMADTLAQHQERLDALDEDVAGLAAGHTRTGLLAVSGSEGLEFQVRETGVSGVIPAVLELPPGTYTLAARASLSDARAAGANVQQAPPIIVQAIVRADQATGVTIPVGGR
ncbi:MAG: hypothetical protein PVJ49_11510 [Acidobacteriota bacterium]|jgi:uncharacterized coiled-coil protein SlyX